MKMFTTGSECRTHFSCCCAVSTTWLLIMYLYYTYTAYWSEFRLFSLIVHRGPLNCVLCMCVCARVWMRWRWLLANPCPFSRLYRPISLFRLVHSSSLNQLTYPLPFRPRTDQTHKPTYRTHVVVWYMPFSIWFGVVNEMWLLIAWKQVDWSG